MARNFSYKKSTSTVLKACGRLNTTDCTILIDEDVKDLGTLLSDFDGADVEMTVKVKYDEDLDEPSDESSY